ncbi:carboxylesterase [Pontibacillus halophilus JSM 076056 = DSM 19796]|uniref:Carboxylesterase n=1 Tax=Pontibacillus halophilus JSM 076056 = DSM 19796 TaxID=1385510 RepID=A0A0A5GIX9_9BACI|nr:alpha/beta hydrolase [Pontibacillus halophilus]KGX91959.1 carboxylesterase [Pontibacillus halophilus JSM 076056 = DSM 19796]
MKHIFHHGKSKDANVLLLLHGTGGNEHDLLPIAEMIDPDAHVLSVRGNVSENGMPRFFRRLEEGVFDEEDLIERTSELNAFLDEASRDYGFNRNVVIAVGYSNGANIAGSLLIHHQDSLKDAILFHPMVPRRGVNVPDLTGRNVFIGAGTNDPICKPEETNELERLLNDAGATVTVHWESMGHRLTESEVTRAKKWYHQI